MNEDNEQKPESKPKRYLGKAPSPIKGVNGAASVDMPGLDAPAVRRGPVGIPDEYHFVSPELRAEVEAILCQAAKKFPNGKYALKMCGYVIAEMTPHLVAAVGTGKVSKDSAVEQMRQLLRELLWHNSTVPLRWLAETPSPIVQKARDGYLFEERVRRSAGWLGMVQAVGGADKKTAGREVSVPPAKTWKQIEITFLSDERIQVFNGDVRQTYNYDEFGFADRRNGKPDAAWGMLLQMTNAGGTIPRPQPGKDKAKKQKRIEEIRKRLKALWKIEADPIPFNGNTYQASFKIRRRSSFDS